MIAAAFRSRGGIFVASAAYAVAVAYCLAHFASVQWAQYGFSFGGYGPTELVLLVLALAIWSAVLPRELESPADLMIVLIYLAVCIPALVVPLGADRIQHESFRLLAMALIAAFATCCLLVRAFATPLREQAAVRRCSPAFVVGMVVLWLACLAVLVAEYRDVMTLVSLDGIYEQRAAGAATSRFMGYAQTYFGYVLSPALLALGLTSRRPILVVLGIAGGVVLYTITAEKNAFAFPFLVILFHLALSRRSALFQSSTFVLAFFAAAVGITVHYYDLNVVAGFVAWYVGVRSILTPGLFAGQYLDFFSNWGFTHLSHVTGLGLVVSPPAAPGGNPRWPSIGHIVGEQFIGIRDLNANASFLASDGIAAFGIPGVFVAFLLLAAFLIAFNRCALGVPRRFTLLIAMPLGLTLTNVSLFTVFLSFGGLFWLVVLKGFFRADAAAAPAPAPDRVPAAATSSAER